MIIIGSNAINQHRKDFREFPSDVDMLCYFDDAINFINSLDNVKVARPINNGKKYLVKTDIIYEIEIIQTDVKEELYNYIMNDEKTIHAGQFIYPSLNLLYALKESHKYLKNNPHFLKTMNDIKFLRSINCSIPNDFYNLFKKIEKETYDYSHPKLNQTKNDFFDDSVKYTYDHDTIHESVKVNDRPAYTYFIKDGSEVLCSKKKFYDCSEHIRNCAVLEESYVLALERSIIPFNTEFKRKEVFDLALMKVCTSITSGWFREWAWENYYTVQKMYNDDYVDKFKLALENKLIKPYKE